jgi:hypothetical protein
LEWTSLRGVPARGSTEVPPDAFMPWKA